jgi:superfamily II DNA/RNA helicase
MLFYVARMPPIFCDVGPYAIIMAPTCDLAQQIERDMVKF